MKNIKRYFGKGNKNNIFIAFTVMLIAGMMTFTLISCGTGNGKGDAEAGSTIIETNAEGETVVVAMDKDGETVIKESQKDVKSSSGKSDSKKATSNSTAKSTTAATTKSTEAQSVCYISIDGYCSGKSIVIQSGDSVYSILKRSGASVSGSSSYVKGINGLYEFDKGPQSGWKYSVNGSTPGVSCGSYKVKAGDNIKWYYVTSL